MTEIELLIIGADNTIEIPMAKVENLLVIGGKVMSVVSVETKKNPRVMAYHHLEPRPDKNSQELFIRGRGVRASTIWHDRYIQRFSPEQIANDRTIPLEAVYEALAFCQENWELICQEKENERQYLEETGFFSHEDLPG